MAASKVFVPLESNPDLFTKLIHDIGVMPCLEFRDVYSIDEPSLLALLPRPVLALILVGPTKTEDAKTTSPEEPELTEHGSDKDILWFKQTIQNACGLYAILHSVSNGSARDYIRRYSVAPPLLLDANLQIQGKTRFLIAFSKPASNALPMSAHRSSRTALLWSKHTSLQHEPMSSPRFQQACKISTIITSASSSLTRTAIYTKSAEAKTALLTKALCL